MNAQTQSSATRRLHPLAAVIDQIGMRKSWIYREIEEGRFPAPLKIGGASRWDSLSIDAWIEERARSARTDR